jgi:hypothetical protein
MLRIILPDRKTAAIIFLGGINFMEKKIIPLEVGIEFSYLISINLIFVVPSIMLYSSEISPKRCNNCVFILRNGHCGE